jgi:hypothetical protein
VARRLSRALLLAAIAAALGYPQAAAAQEPGVNFDADSPAGKEYVIPLADARSLGRPGASDGGAAAARPGSAARANDDEAQLFGDGVQPAAATGSASRVQGSGARRGDGTQPGGSDGAGVRRHPFKGEARESVSSGSHTVAALSVGRSQQTWTAAAIAAAVLLLAGGVALVARLRSRP